MEELRDRIKKNRSNLSDSSIKTYVSILKNLFYKAHDKTNKINPDWFDNEKEVLNLLKDKTPETRKTQLACLIVFVNSLTFNLIVYCYFKLIIKLYKSQNYVIQLIHLYY